MANRKLNTASPDPEYESSSDDFTDIAKHLPRTPQPQPTARPDVISRSWHLSLYPKVHFYYGPMINGRALKPAKPVSTKARSSKTTSTRSPSKSFMSTKHPETYSAFYSQGGKVWLDWKYEVTFTYWQIFTCYLSLLPVFYGLYLQRDYRKAVAEHRIPLLCQSTFFSDSGICTKIGFENPTYEQLVLVSHNEGDDDPDKKKPLVTVRVPTERTAPRLQRGPPVGGSQKTKESYITAGKRLSTVIEDESISTPQEDEYTKIEVIIETIEVPEDTEPLGNVKPLEAVKQAFSFFNTLTELKYLTAKCSIFEIQLSDEPPTLKHILSKADITTQNNLPIQAAWDSTLSSLLTNLHNQLTCHLNLGQSDTPSGQHLSLQPLTSILKKRFYLPWTPPPNAEIRKAFTHIASHLHDSITACPTPSSLIANINNLENLLILLTGDALAPEQKDNLANWKFWKTQLLLHGGRKYDVSQLQTWQLARYFLLLEGVRRAQEEIEREVRRVVGDLQASEGRLEGVEFFGLERREVKGRVREYEGLVRALYGYLERMTEEAEGVAERVRERAKAGVNWG